MKARPLHVTTAVPLAQHHAARRDRLLVAGARGVAGIASAIMLLIVLFLLLEAAPVLRNVGPWRFVTDASWFPTTGQFNLLPMIAGTLMLVACAVLLASLLGIALAIFCQYYAPPVIAKGYRRALAVLAGIPSVVYGLWGLTVIVPRIAAVHPPGASLLAGILVLSWMIFPTIALVTESHFGQVSRQYMQAAAALGLGRWATVRGVIMPAAREGLLSGVLLQTGRALGETMAVLMVCGNVVQIPRSFFDPMRTLTANIVLEMAHAAGDHRAALFVSGLALTACSTFCIGVAYRLSGRRSHG